MEFFLLYLYTVFEDIANVASGVAGVGIVTTIVVGIIVFFVCGLENDLDKLLAFLGRQKGLVKAWFWIIVVCFLIGTFVPSKKEIAWIIGGGVAFNVGTSEQARQLPDNVLKAANRFLEDISEEETKDGDHEKANGE